MSKQKTITLTLTHSDACLVRLALGSIALDFRKELANPATPPERWESCVRSCAMWDALHDEIVRQMNNHNKEE